MSKEITPNKYMGMFLHCFIAVNEVVDEWINIQ
jgi:hypothetical protein